MNTGPQTAAQEWKAHWPLVFSAMIGFSFFAVVTYTLGTFIEPLEKQFGWSRAEISLGLTIFGIVHVVGSPPVGALLDKVGTRRVAVPAMIASGLAFSAFSLADGSLARWVWLWIVFSVCSLGIKSTIWSAGASSVFTRSRGLALAAVLSGSALGQSLSPIVANVLIESQGWQSAYQWIGLCWAGFSTILLLLFFRDARALHRPTQSTKQAASAPLPGLTVRQASRDSRVLRIGGANLLMSLVGSGVGVHMVPLITATGMDRSSAVEMAAAAGIAGIAGKFLVGWLLDRVQGNLVPFTSFAVAGLGHLLLLNWLDTPMALLLGSMCIGYSSGAGLQVSTYLISRYAGLRNFGTIFGSIGSAMMAGAACGPVIAGVVFDMSGSYAPLLLMAAPVMLICSFLFVGLGAYPVFEQPRPSPSSGLIQTSEATA